jgi:hypothetical protein
MRVRRFPETSGWKELSAEVYTDVCYPAWISRRSPSLAAKMVGRCPSRVYGLPRDGKF